MRALALVTVLGVAGVASANPAGLADRFLAAHRAELAAPIAELGRPSLERSLGADGWVARYRQSRSGIPVIGAEVVLRLDGQGRVLRFSSTAVALPALELTAAVRAVDAVAVVRAAGAAGVEHPNSVTLAIDPHAVGGPRLLWAVRLVPVPQLLENALYLVDAQSGVLLRRFDLLRYAKASVFRQNPIETPAPAATDIATPFQPTAVDKSMQSALLEGLNCLDKDQTSSFMGIPVHICTVTHTAFADANGDFAHYTPAMEPFTAPFNGCPNAKYGTMPIDFGTDLGTIDERQPLDEFSEQHMYWHVANVYAYFRTLFEAGGMHDFKLRQQPLPVAVNLCTPDFSAGLSNLTGPLVPFDNAFFSPGMNNPISAALIGGRDAIMFGQGSSYDFAYDGDVIDHEFTHAIIDTLGKLTTPGFEDTQGLNDDPGSMNEALADYFSSAIGGDPALGEYAGRNIPGGTGAGAEGAIRNLDNKLQCADDRWGEVHQDSQPFSAGAWGARKTIAGDPKQPSFNAQKAQLFDRAVLAAIQGFADPTDMPTAAAAIADEAGLLLDAAAKQAVLDSYATHKILPRCDRIITWTGTNKKDLLFLEGIDSQYAATGATRVPSFVQWKVDVPPGQDSVTIKLNVRATGGGGFMQAKPPKLELAVGPPGQPIAWVPDTNSGNQVTSVPLTGTGLQTATLSGLPFGSNYVMLLNTGGSSSVGLKIEFSTSCSQASGCPTTTDDGGTDDAGVGVPEGKKGCNCQLGGRGGDGSWWSLWAILAGLAAFTIRRRRSRPLRSPPASAGR